MSIYHNTQPDLEPIEFTHFDCWDDDTTMEEIVMSWEASLGITLPTDTWDAVIMTLLRHGYDVYEGDEFIEIYQSE
jgi:hypothetical protein